MPALQSGLGVLLGLGLVRVDRVLLVDELAVPGPDLFAQDSEADLYAAIDVVTKKIEQQIRKRQSKFKARNHTEASRKKRTRQEAEA